jgi:nicotinamide mononucleotide adenylyltransferase
VRGVMVHGRFQPFHNEHLEYALEGLARSNGLLVVGITNPFPGVDPEQSFGAEAHRHTATANPYSFLERAQMVKRSLADEDVDLLSIHVIPFHLDLLEHYASLAGDVDFLVNVLEEWDEEKCRRFTAAGFSVTRFHRPRSMSGTEVRERIEADDRIDHLVPRGTLGIVEAAASSSVGSSPMKPAVGPVGAVDTTEQPRSAVSRLKFPGPCR